MVIMRKLPFFLLLLLCVACAKKQHSGDVKIHFDIQVDGSHLHYHQMQYQNAAGNRYQVDEVKFFISDVAFLKHYLQTAHFTDRQLGRLLSWADTASVMQNATIVITGDHRIFHAWINDEIREYGIRAHLPFGVNYAGCPFILAGPKVVSRTLQQGLQVDIFTTTLHAIGQSEYFWKGTGHNLLEDYTASASEGNLRRQISDKLIRTNYFANSPF